MSKTTGTTPAGDYAGLVEKLNLPWPDHETEEVTLPAWVLELMAEAATAIAALVADRDETKNQYDSAAYDRDAHRDQCTKLLARAEAAEAQVKAMDEALAFYADVSKYPAPLTGGMGALWHDCGEIARRARPVKGGEADA